MSRAFTIMELILVIVMLSVIALLFVSYTGDVGNVSVDAAAWKIQSDLRHAQQLATTTGVTHGVVFVQGGNYTVYRESVATPVADPLERGPMVKDVSNFGNISIANDYQVEFDTMGRPAVGGGGSVDIVADSGARRRIYVIDNTGAVVLDVVDEGVGCTCRICNVRRQAADYRRQMTENR